MGAGYAEELFKVKILPDTDREAGVIKEIYFPEWLANTVVVKKKNGKWR